MIDKTNFLNFIRLMIVRTNHIDDLSFEKRFENNEIEFIEFDWTNECNVKVKLSITKFDNEEVN